ncbi:MAG: selenocysteine lyase, partial [Bacteroidales bacterium]|nr:selenocysteine lyase [Bacteroidales bacterium]
QAITDRITHGDLSEKPGWIRVSLHPTMTDDEVKFIAHAVKSVAENAHHWALDYDYLPRKNEFRHKSEPEDKTERVRGWFVLD